MRALFARMSESNPLFEASKVQLEKADSLLQRLKGLVALAAAVGPAAALADSPEHWQMNFQDPATPIAKARRRR